VGSVLGVCLRGSAAVADRQCHRSADPIFHWIVHRVLVLVDLT